MYLIKNVCVFDGVELLENKNVLISHGKIIDIVGSLSPYAHKVHKEIDGEGNILAPGFIDIQVNGGGGVFFNDAPIVETIKKIRDTHLQFGTTSFLPTFISDSFHKVTHALNAVKECIEQALPGVLGIHLEGPYLNSQKNGIHHNKHIHTPTKEEINEICQFNFPIKLVTLAPEIVPKELLEQLYKNNILIFAGHTNATFKQMQEYFTLGVCGITHFFNACSPLTSREAGVVGAGLFNDKIWCGLIADGLHVSYDTINIAFKTKGSTHFILVSDAMPPVGTNLNEFEIHGQKIYVKDNKYIDANGTLAGSSLTMHQAVKNIVTNNCASLTDALAMASTNVAECLQLEHVKGRIYPNYDADLVLLKKDDLNLLKVIQAGVVIK